MNCPKLSFIVLSYNYEGYIGQTIRSILEQTVQDLEVIVIDDGSTDRSCEVVTSFGDPRIRLLVNERNIGGAASYNRAVLAAKGDYLVNLDADDWIAPTKSERQLAYLAENRVEIVGTYVTFLDSAGEPHPQTELLDGLVNRYWNLNTIDAWVGRNNLTRSSTMVDRHAHLQVGLDDPAMKRACDYELWTRFLLRGYRFGVVPEKLTFYRLHSRGVTHADPRGSMLELSFAMMRNLVPLVERRGAYLSLSQIINWITNHSAFVTLTPLERYRLLGTFLVPQSVDDYTKFCELISGKDADHSLRTVGQRLLSITMLATEYGPALDLRTDIEALIKARDYWSQQTQNWRQEYENLQEENSQQRAAISALTEARDYWHNEAMYKVAQTAASTHNR